MNSYPHKNNLICLSQIKDWQNVILDIHNNLISIDDRYFQSVRPGYQLDIKNLYSLLRTNFYHYYMIIDFPIKNISDNEITNINSAYINLLELANTGLLKVYNNYYYYKHPDAHLLKELNLKNSIMINNYKNEYQKSELPTHSKSISSFFKKDINYLDKEINNEYLFNMKSLFNFSKDKFFNITKLETIQEPKEFKFNNKLILENQTINDINVDIDSININDNSNSIDNSNNVDNVDNVNNEVIKENEENELNKSKTIVDIEPSSNDLNNTNNVSEGNNTNNVDEGNNTNNLNYGFNQEYYNARYEQLSFTETCMFKAMNMYIEVSNFFFSVKQKVIRNFNYYFRQNNNVYN